MCTCGDKPDLSCPVHGLPDWVRNWREYDPLTVEHAGLVWWAQTVAACRYMPIEYLIDAYCALQWTDDNDNVPFGHAICLACSALESALAVRGLRECDSPEEDGPFDCWFVSVN